MMQPLQLRSTVRHAVTALVALLTIATMLSSAAALTTATGASADETSGLPPDDSLKDPGPFCEPPSSGTWYVHSTKKNVRFTTPDASHSYPTLDPECNNNVTIAKIGRGLYRVHLPYFTGKVAIATAVGSKPTSCNVVRIVDEDVTVRCRNRMGRAVNANFTLLGGHNQAFVWANKMRRAFYSPEVSLVDEDAQATVARIGVGRYVVHLPGANVVAGEMALLVNAQGDTDARCRVVQSSGQHATVACANARGRARDARFFVKSVEKGWTNGPMDGAGNQTSMSPSVHVERTDTGRYLVHAPDASTKQGGVVAVTTRSGNSRLTCQIKTMARESLVICKHRSGRFVDSEFTVQIVREGNHKVFPLVRISGQAWFDTNGNGLIDTAEPLLPNTVVRLRTSGGFVREAHTNSRGSYVIGTSLANFDATGEASVTFETNEPELTPTRKDVGTDDRIDSDISRGGVALLEVDRMTPDNQQLGGVNGGWVQADRCPVPRLCDLPTDPGTIDPGPSDPGPTGPTGPIDPNDIDDLPTKPGQGGDGV
jgi:hypothetical protein